MKALVADIVSGFLYRAGGEFRLNRIKKHVEARYKIPFTYSDEVVKLVVSRCTESESGGRMIDAILTNTMLPDISREFLNRMMEGTPIAGVEVDATEGQFAYRFAA
jgi:type VI secretion system protein VasG